MPDFVKSTKTEGFPWKTLEDVVEDVHPYQAFPWKTYIFIENEEVLKFLKRSTSSKEMLDRGVHLPQRLPTSSKENLWFSYISERLPGKARECRSFWELGCGGLSGPRPSAYLIDPSKSHACANRPVRTDTHAHTCVRTHTPKSAHAHVHACPKTINSSGPERQYPQLITFSSELLTAPNI